MSRKKYDSDIQAENAIECIIIKATSPDLGLDQVESYIDEIEFICNEHGFDEEKLNNYKRDIQLKNDFK